MSKEKTINIPEESLGDLIKQGFDLLNEEECPKCDGRGFCLTCDGYGQINGTECPDCSGSGNCPECDGYGKIKK